MIRRFIRRILYRLSNRRSVSVPAVADTDIRREYVIHKDCKGHEEYGRIFKAEHATSGMDTYLCSLSDCAEQYNNGENQKFVFFLCYIDFHETVHEFEEEITRDKHHGDRWLFTYVDIENHVQNDYIWDIVSGNI